MKNHLNLSYVFNKSKMRNISILQIDYDNIIVTKNTVKDRVVFTIDNFYKYPNSIIRRYHKNQDKSIDKNDNTYPGTSLSLKDIIGADEVEQHTEDLRSLLCSHGFESSRFISSRYDQVNVCRLSSEIVRQKGRLLGNHLKDKGPVSNPHTDASPGFKRLNTLACLCYLSKDTHGGTGLYYNKQLKTFCTSVDFENENRWDMWKKVEGATTDEEKLDIIEAHCIDRNEKTYPNLITKGPMNKSDEYFDLIHFFPMKFNRLIVYEGDIVHSMYMEDENFFKVHERLTSNYFLGIVWDETLKNVSKVLSPLESSSLEKMIAHVISTRKVTLF